MKDNMEELILAVVIPLVDHQEKVAVLKVEDERHITYVLTVDPEDMGKVIGKQGRVAKAIRTVVYAAASSAHMKKILLEIKE
jgi:predicted RNA-binding protein YlqC (UPF0109 family)